MASAMSPTINYVFSNSIFYIFYRCRRGTERSCQFFLFLALKLSKMLARSSYSGFTYFGCGVSRFVLSPSLISTFRVLNALRITSIEPTAFNPIKCSITSPFNVGTSIVTCSKYSANMDIQSFLSDEFIFPIASKQFAAVARANSLFEESNKNSLNGLIAFPPDNAITSGNSSEAQLSSLSSQIDQ